MAKVGKNLILHGVTGKLGDQIVIRQRGGQTVLSQAPGTRSKPATAAQLEHQALWQQAIIYGKNKIAVPEEKAAYAKKAEGAKSAFNVAVADFMNAPQIDEIDLTQYGGQVGDTIRVRAVDDFKVMWVRVQISNADGSVVEEGEAVQQDNKLDWVYTATVVNDATAGDKIVVQVSDKPGHVAEQEKAI